MTPSTGERAPGTGPAPAGTLPPLAPGAAMRWDVVRTMLPPTARRVLEVGCGQGAFAVRLAQRYPDLLAVEPDPTSYRVAAARLAALGRGEVRNCTSEDLPAGSSFDLVCAFEVLEHLEHDRQALESWVALLAPGGTLLLSTPAHAGRMGAWDELVGHYRRYDPAAMAALLRSAGLVDVDVRLYGWPLGPALETARNQVAARRLSAGAGQVAEGAPADLTERTAASGRQLQPARRASALAVRLAVAPFLPVQRRVRTRGIALVAAARRPA